MLGRDSLAREIREPGVLTDPSKRSGAPRKLDDETMHDVCDRQMPMAEAMEKAKVRGRDCPTPPTLRNADPRPPLRVSASTISRARRRLNKAAKKPKPADQPRVDAATPRTVEKMFLRLCSALLLLNIFTFAPGTLWPTFVPGRERCWAGFDETDIKLIVPGLIVLCNPADEPKKGMYLDMPTLKISAVLGSRADGQPLAVCLIIKVRTGGSGMRVTRVVRCEDTQ